MDLKEFYKYHGTGNDFILFDNRDGQLSSGDPEWIRGLCHRRFGIGADGIIFLEEAQQPDTDFSMAYFNADGQTGSLCGNGGRCVVAFAKMLGLIRDRAIFTAFDGIHEASIDPDGAVLLKMAPVNTIEKGPGFYVLDTGSPHYVCFMEEVDHLDVYAMGRAIRYNDRFRQEGVNVNFATADPGNLRLRTYERGVEAETWACGTGAVATAVSLAAHLALADQDHRIPVHTKGGILEISFRKTSGEQFLDISLKGMATFVYQGKVAG